MASFDFVPIAMPVELSKILGLFRKLRMSWAGESRAIGGSDPLVTVLRGSKRARYTF
jgi:hypothetical protein